MLPKQANFVRLHFVVPKEGEVAMWKGLLIAALVLVCLGVVAVSYIVPNIRIHQQTTGSGDRVSVETPFGSVNVNKQKEAAVDLASIPIYPGAERTKKDGGGAVVDFNWNGNEKQLAISGAEFVTDDPVDKVRAWYRSQLPDWQVENRELSHSERGRKRIVAVEQRNGRTRIGIASFGEPLAN